MDNFYNTAIMVIYEDGNIDRLQINEEALHMFYFAMLYKESNNFKKIILDNKINFSDKNIKNLLTYELDLDLARNKVVAIHNLSISEIMKEDNYLKHSIPKFIFTLPNDLTVDQKEVLKQMLTENDLYDSEFLVYDKDHFEVFEYEDIINLVYQKKY